MQENTKHDVRLLDRMLASGQITQAEHDGFLKDLPDTKDKADNVEEALADRNDAVAPATPVKKAAAEAKPKKAAAEKTAAKKAPKKAAKKKAGK
ncbi:MAG: hypothetical protein ISR64_10375 [Deltaproteobacteria bacterium]|nr:hypothetical protein [Deltaproteobacteria bacterium]